MTSLVTDKLLQLVEKWIIFTQNSTISLRKSYIVPILVMQALNPELKQQGWSMLVYSFGEKTLAN